MNKIHSTLTGQHHGFSARDSKWSAEIQDTGTPGSPSRPGLTVPKRSVNNLDRRLSC